MTEWMVDYRAGEHHIVNKRKTTTGSLDFLQVFHVPGGREVALELRPGTCQVKWSTPPAHSLSLSLCQLDFGAHYLLFRTTLTTEE